MAAVQPVKLLEDSLEGVVGGMGTQPVDNEEENEKNRLAQTAETGLNQANMSLQQRIAAVGSKGAEGTASLGGLPRRGCFLCPYSGFRARTQRSLEMMWISGISAAVVQIVKERKG